MSDPNRNQRFSDTSQNGSLRRRQDRNPIRTPSRTPATSAAMAPSILQRGYDYFTSPRTSTTDHRVSTRNASEAGAEVERLREELARSENAYNQLQYNGLRNEQDMRDRHEQEISRLQSGYEHEVQQILREQKAEWREKEKGIWNYIDQKERDHKEEKQQLKQKYSADLQAQEAEQVQSLTRNFQRRLQGHVKDMEQEKQIVETSCAKLEAQLEASEETIRSLQSSKLQSVESTRWAPLSISDTEHKLQSILQEIRQWSQKYAKLNIEVLLENTRFQSICDGLVELQCVCPAPDAVNRLLHELMGSKALQKPGKASSMLLTATASSFLLRNIMGNPFFVFARDAPEKLVLSRHGHALQEILAMLKSSDENGAETWRCQLMRLVDTKAELSGTTWTSLAKSLAAHFMRCFAVHYCENLELPDGMCFELVPIVQQIINLGFEVWTRKARHDVLLWPQLINRSNKDITYSSSAPEGNMELHAIHGRDVDDDPQALDGRSVSIICSPAITSAGNADGEGYDNMHVVKKAVVWLG